MGCLLAKKIPLSWLAVYVGAQLMCIGMIVMSSTGPGMQPAPAHKQVLHQLTQKVKKGAVDSAVAKTAVPRPGDELADR